MKSKVIPAIGLIVLFVIETKIMIFLTIALFVVCYLAIWVDDAMKERSRKKYARLKARIRSLEGWHEKHP